MKRVLLSFLLTAPFLGFSQVDEEALYLRGGLSFSSSDVEQSIMVDTSGLSQAAKINSFSINAGGGYMFTEVFGAGLNLGFSSVGMKPAEGDTLSATTTTNVFSIAPEARVFLEIDEPLYFTGLLTVGLGFGNTNTSQSFGGQTFEADQKFSTFAVAIAPGLTYFLSDNVALDVTFGSIGYQSTTQKVDAGDGTTIDQSVGGFEFAVDMSTLNFGLTVFLNN
jgi:opacity protein-like surface antigen